MQSKTPSIPIVAAPEILALLRHIIQDPEKLKAVHATWDQVYAGDVTFNFAGWTLMIFNDCNELDYITHCVAPDGRSGEYSDWRDAEPVEQLTPEE